MDGEMFFRQQARECREAAASVDAASGRALMQLAKYYEKEARTASETSRNTSSQTSELNRH
jgi:hypothetical protein